jgi:hypothetical protein
MQTKIYAHRYADIILNSDYQLKQEIESVIASLTMPRLDAEFEELNARRAAEGKKSAKGKQSTANIIFKQEFTDRGWEAEKNVFNDPGNDLAIDFWKR